MIIDKKFRHTVFNKDQSGAALVIAIFSILLVTVIGFALVATGLISQDISRNSRQQTDAYYIAESGLNHALTILKGVDPSTFSSILAAGDGVANTGDELSLQPASVTPIPQAGIAIGGGKYVVFVINDAAEAATPTVDTNKTIVVRSVGYGADGSTATLEAIVSNLNINRPGILADGDINVSNNLTVTGPSGSIQANGTFSTNNPVCVNISVGEGTNTGMNLSKISTPAPGCGTAGAVGSTVLYSQPAQVPEIHDVANLRSVFRPQANWIFKSDGSIYRQGATLAMSPAEITADGLAGWSCNSCGTANHSLWAYSSATVLSTGTYYMESCDMQITNGGGSPPPQVTLIAEGSVQINNNPSFQPKLNGYAVIAGNDVSLSSSIGVVGNPGMIYAYGQMQITNTSVILGWLQSANYRHADGTHGLDINNFENQNLVSYSSNGAIRISGQTTVTTPTGWNVGPGLTVSSRREVRY